MTIIYFSAIVAFGKKMKKQILSLELTTHCQQNCLHCFARKNGTKFIHMPLSQARDIMKEGVTLGFETLHLTGGEVLLYPYLFDVLDEARELSFSSFFINTNGHLLDEEICQKLSTYKGIEFSLSLNGPKSFHDDIRGEGAYNAATAGLKIALQQDLKVHIFTLVSKNNLEILPHYSSQLFSDFPEIQDLTFIQLRSGPEGEKDKLSPEDYASLVRTTALLGLAGLSVQILENPLSTAVALKMGYTHLPPSPHISRDGRILVFADGRIGDNHSSSLNLGTYEPGKIQEILLSKEYNNILEENEIICSSCAFIDDCRKADLIRPSDEDHNTVPYDIPFCQKVMALV